MEGIRTPDFWELVRAQSTGEVGYGLHLAR